MKVCWYCYGLLKYSVKECSLWPSSIEHTNPTQVGWCKFMYSQDVSSVSQGPIQPHNLHIHIHAHVYHSMRLYKFQIWTPHFIWLELWNIIFGLNKPRISLKYSVIQQTFACTCNMQANQWKTHIHTLLKVPTMILTVKIPIGTTEF